MKNCRECEYHKLIPDPDPYDWFRNMDMAMVCTLTPHKNRDKESLYWADRSIYKPILVSIAYNSEIEKSKIPEWCPLNKKKEKQDVRN